jgi:hypothetical protein
MSSVNAVEDEVDDSEHGVEPLRKQVGGRDSERDRGVADLVLRAGKPLAHRLERDKQRGGHLLGGQPAECAQGQRDLGVQGECRMAAGEDQLEAFVGKCRRLVHGLLGCLG